MEFDEVGKTTRKRFDLYDCEIDPGMTQQRKKRLKSTWDGREKKRKKERLKRKAERLNGFFGFWFDLKKYLFKELKKRFIQMGRHEKRMRNCLIFIGLKFGKDEGPVEERSMTVLMKNSRSIVFRWASLLGRQICEKVTQVSKARLGEDRNLA